MKSYLTVPKVGLTLLLVVLTYFGTSLFSDPVNISIGLIYFSIAGLTFAMYLQKRKDKALFDRYLEVHAVVNGGSAFLFLFIFPLEFFIFSDPSIISNWFLAAWLVICGLALVGTYQYLMETMEEVKLRYDKAF